MATSITGCVTFRFSSEANIREAFLKRTPVGTSLEDVEKFIESKGYGTHGYNKYENEIGSVRVGKYVSPFPFYTYVYVTWVFDKELKLVNIVVVKEADTL